MPQGPTRVCGLPIALLLVTNGTGCASWETTYVRASDPDPDAADVVPALVDEADRLAAEAGDRGRLESAIAAYEKVLKKDGANFRALSELGHLYVLLGAAYGKDEDEKERFYKRAADFNTRAMYTNPRFKELVDGGADLGEASRALGKREMDAMGFWCQSLFYYYKECIGSLDRVVNYPWIVRAQAVLARMEKVDPGWQRGGLPFSVGILYIALPESAGGDKRKAEEKMNSAVEEHPDVIRNRWGRAKYYHTVVGDKGAFRRDMEWVLKQDAGGWGPYAWNVYFRDDARRMLADIDRTFD